MMKSPNCKRWILGAVHIDPCSAVANALSIPHGEYVRTKGQIILYSMTTDHVYLSLLIGNDFETFKFTVLSKPPQFTYLSLLGFILIK